MNIQRTWPFCPEIQEDELLSSYLARVAHTHGQNPYRFCSYFFPKKSIWNRDLDRSVPDDLIVKISEYSGISYDKIALMTLQRYEETFKAQTNSRKIVHSGVSPWINSIGVFHRVRRRYGMQYCPHCLKEDFSYKKIWRLSFVTVCAKHECGLMDCCYRCGAQVIYHRTDSSVVSCHCCGSVLAVLPLGQLRRDDFSKRLYLQEYFLSILQSKFVLLNGECVTAQDFFRGLSILFQVFKAQIKRKRENENLPICYLFFPTGQIEMSRLVERVQQCLLLRELLIEWPKRAQEIGELLALTRTFFANIDSVPEWLHHLLATFPAGVRHHRGRDIFTLRNELRKIHRKKRDTWRTDRANLLLKAAGY